MVLRDLSVGSAAYNPPELWEIEEHQEKLMQQGYDLIRDQEHLNEVAWYDGIKADIFSAAGTLFLLKLMLAPFRRAHPRDPYYQRLAFKGNTKKFWKIYDDIIS